MFGTWGKIEGRSVFELRTAVAHQSTGVPGSSLGCHDRGRAQLWGRQLSSHTASCPVATILEFLIIFETKGLVWNSALGLQLLPQSSGRSLNRPVTFSMRPHPHPFIHSSLYRPLYCLLCQVPFWAALSFDLGSVLFTNSLYLFCLW